MCLSCASLAIGNDAPIVALEGRGREGEGEGEGEGEREEEEDRRGGDR